MSDIVELEPFPAPADGWTDAGMPPQLEWLKIDRLRIDRGFQRPVGASGRKTIAAIVAGFTWSKFAPVIVAPLPGGVYSVIDGQHRSIAARARGFDAVPRQQAEAFAAINGTVTPITVQALYKAGLAAGEPWAMAIKRAADRAGCVPLTYPKMAKAMRPGETNSIGYMRRILQRQGEPCLAAVLCVLMAVGGREPNFVDYQRMHLVMPVLAAHPDWCAAPEACGRACAGLAPEQLSAEAVERRLKAALGAGRPSADDAEFIAKVRELKGRRLSPQMIAAQLRRPYADIERAVAS